MWQICHWNETEWHPKRNLDYGEPNGGKFLDKIEKRQAEMIELKWLKNLCWLGACKCVRVCEHFHVSNKRKVTKWHVDWWNGMLLFIFYVFISVELWNMGQMKQNFFIILLFTRRRINGKSNISARKYQNNAAVNTFTHLHTSAVQWAYVTHSMRTQCKWNDRAQQQKEEQQR